jgi:23S rRNA (uridine2552-2'-O)-methyltransferase
MVKPPTGGDDSGRAKPARLKKTKTPHHVVQQAWLERQINDPFSAKARAMGYRSRAAFKLSEIDDRSADQARVRVIDLGCAPGGWLQVAVERGAAPVVGVDLLPIDPVAAGPYPGDGLHRPGLRALLIELLGGAPDVVLSDMAPNTVGHRETDHLRIVGLIEMGGRVRHAGPEARRRLRDQGLPGRGDGRGHRPPEAALRQGAQHVKAQGQPRGQLGAVPGGDHVPVIPVAL